MLRNLGVALGAIHLISEVSQSNIDHPTPIQDIL